jgi:hypothetical protein
MNETTTTLQMDTDGLEEYTPFVQEECGDTLWDAVLAAMTD